jgi:hypothetical protein
MLSKFQDVNYPIKIGSFTSLRNGCAINQNRAYLQQLALNAEKRFCLGLAPAIADRRCTLHRKNDPSFYEPKIGEILNPSICGH